MNNLWKKLINRHSGKDRTKNFVISIVILIEILSLCVVGTFAWVETVSSIKITNETNTHFSVADSVYTDVTIGSGTATIELADYFKQSGDMHLAPCSSADGTTFFFPMVNNAAGNYSAYTKYRKGTSSDKNTTYLSVSFRLKVDENADIFFTTNTITVSDDIRVSVTSKSLGSNTAPETKIFANSAGTTPVVSSTDGKAGATTVNAFGEYKKGITSPKKIFSVSADETKVVTINVWLQKKSNTNAQAGQVVTDNTDLTATTGWTASRVLQNIGITSGLTPRRVTLIPTPTWDISSATNQTFYAWCWAAPDPDGAGPLTAPADRLYKLELDEDEHYSVEYNGTYTKTLFFRCGNPNLTTASMSGNWSSLGLWNKTADTTIPDDPVNPAYVIETISGGSYDNDISANKSTGKWLAPAVSGMTDYAGVPGVATVTVGHITDQEDTYGSISATSYIGSTTSTHVMEKTNSDSTSKHYRTVHAWPGKKLQLKATANTGYAFVGWYTDAEGTVPASGTYTNATYTPNAQNSASQVIYYARFKKVRKIILKQYVEKADSGATPTFESSSAAASLDITDSTAGASTTGDNKTKSRIVDYNSAVTLKSTLTDTGYGFAGFYSVESGGSAMNNVSTSGNQKSVVINASSANYETTYYVRYTANPYTVTAHSRYSTNNGSSYSSSDAVTGGTVQVGTASSGASSNQSVKYKHTVTLTATAAADYKFDGWYDAATGGNQLSSSATYSSYTLNTSADVDVYARFTKNKFNVTAHACYSTNGGSSYTEDNLTGGTVKVGSASAGATSTAKATYNGSTVSLVATPASGYEFDGWYNGTSSSATRISTNASYNYQLTTYGAVNVYARFIEETWEIKYGVHGASGWSSEPMTASGNTLTATMTLTEGQNFSFKLCKTVGSNNTWYGHGSNFSTSYENITSTNFISNLTLSDSGDDIFMRGHAGTYTFTFNKSTKVLNVTASYSNITITLVDSTNDKWLGNGSAIFYLDCSGYSGVLMTKGTNQWTASIPSNTRVSNIEFKRNPSDNSTTWNKWTWSRSYDTTFYATDGNKDY